MIASCRDVEESADQLHAERRMQMFDKHVFSPFTTHYVLLAQQADPVTALGSLPGEIFYLIGNQLLGRRHRLGARAHWIAPPAHRHSAERKLGAGASIHRQSLDFETGDKFGRLSLRPANANGNLHRRKEKILRFWQRRRVPGLLCGLQRGFLASNEHMSIRPI